MIRYAAAAVVVAWAAGVTSYVLADRLIPVKPATPEPAPLPPLVEATGRLEAIDGRSGRLTLLSGERPLTLRCDEGTTVFIGGRMGSVDELDERARRFESPTSRRTARRWPSGSRCRRSDYAPARAVSASTVVKMPTTRPSSTTTAEP